MTESIATLSQKLDAVLAQLTYVADRQRQQEELIAELVPIGKAALATTIDRLDDFDKRGYFAFAKELAAIADKVVGQFTPADVRQLGDAIVPILEAVRAMTQPSMLAIATDATAALDEQASVKPLGMMGMVRATRDDDVQKGMGLMIEVLRRIGHGANAMAAQHAKLADKKTRLAEVLGSRKRKLLGIEAKQLPAPAAAKPDSGPACAVPRPPKPAVAMIDGIAYSEDGHLADPAAWTRELCETLASLQGVALTDAHWTVIDAARADFGTTGMSPNIRRLTQITNVSTKEVYALFPKAPGRTIAKIAGLPKPAGCL